MLLVRAGRVLKVRILSGAALMTVDLLLVRVLAPPSETDPERASGTSLEETLETGLGKTSQTGLEETQQIGPGRTLERSGPSAAMIGIARAVRAESFPASLASHASPAAKTVRLPKYGRAGP